MEYDIQINQKDHVIYVNVSGDRDIQTDNNMVQEIMRKVAETGIQKVLIDLSQLRFELSTPEIFKRAMDMLEQRLKQKTVSTRVALVYVPGNLKLDEDMHFFEITCQNRGIPYRVFTHMGKAKEWLET